MAKSPELSIVSLFFSIFFSPLYSQVDSIFIRFRLFSGREPPKAVVGDSPRISEILDSLETLKSLPVLCSDIPPMGSSPEYTGTSLTLIEGLDQKTVIARLGFLEYLSGSCYRDPGQNLERLAVSIAFTLDDVSQVAGNPRPMTYLACMVPTDLHPDVAPCSTSVIKPFRHRHGLLSLGEGSSAVFSVNGRLLACPLKKNLYPWFQLPNR